MSAPSRPTVAQAWMNYLTIVVNDVSPLAVAELRAAFYVGAETMLAAITRHLDDGVRVDLDYLAGLAREITAYMGELCNERPSRAARARSRTRAAG